MDTTEQEPLPATVEELEAWAASATPVEVETQAGWWLRSLSVTTAALERLDELEAGEVARIRRHYAKQRAPLTDRRGALERSLEALARLVRFPKGRKSLALAYGTIGARDRAASVRITDPAAAVAWAKSAGLVDGVKVEEKPVHKVLAAAVMALPAAPDGFELLPASTDYYCSANTLGALEVSE